MTQIPLLFNPAHASLEELEATFVARRPQLERLERDLLADARKKTRRHWQLVGRRGIGKSHFCELLGRRLVRDHGWAVVRISEEHLRIGSVGELLEEIVIRLERCIQSPFAHIQQISDVEELAIDRIRRWRTEHNTEVLVILESLETLLDRQLRDRRSQGRLREILTRDPPFVFLGTAARHAAATVQHAAPFYDFFQTLTLETLSLEEVIELVVARARWDRDNVLLSRLETVRARVHAVFHLSGGNPRSALALYAILKQGLTKDFYHQLLKLLDDATPHYQQQLTSISPQMGRILTEMALARDAVTPAEIARHCRIPVNHVTANIAKLVAEHVVRPTGRPDKRRRFYDINDRLFRLWMQMREDRATDQRLRFLSEFFQRWYEGRPDTAGAPASRAAEVSTYRLLQDLLDAPDATSPSFTTIVEQIATDAPRAELQAAFVAWMPGAARTHPGGATRALRAYQALRDRGLLPSDLVPYSAALELREAPARLAALSPELREAVELLEEASRTVPPRGSGGRVRPRRANASGAT